LNKKLIMGCHFNKSNAIKIRTLIQLRDTLFPKLMSGGK
jgi:hypothetical protein